jgi:hypothetical protein
MPALRGDDDLDEGLVALPLVPLQGGMLRLKGLAAARSRPYA